MLIRHNALETTAETIMKHCSDAARLLYLPCCALCSMLPINAGWPNDQLLAAGASRSASRSAAARFMKRCSISKVVKVSAAAGVVRSKFAEQPR